MSRFPKPERPRQAHSLLATQPIHERPRGPNGSTVLIVVVLVGVVLLAALAVAGYFGNVKLGKVIGEARSAKVSSDAAVAAAQAAQHAAEADAADAKAMRDAEGGLLKSIGDALSSSVSSGVLTKEQLTSIKEQIRSLQVARGAGASLATPGAPGVVPRGSFLVETAKAPPANSVCLIPAVDLGVLKTAVLCP